MPTLCSLTHGRPVALHRLVREVSVVIAAPRSVLLVTERAHQTLGVPDDIAHWNVVSGHEPQRQPIGRASLPLPAEHAAIGVSYVFYPYGRLVQADRVATTQPERNTSIVAAVLANDEVRTDTG